MEAEDQKLGKRKEEVQEAAGGSSLSAALGWFCWFVES
jgi:hypothetical protein